MRKIDRKKPIKLDNQGLMGRFMLDINALRVLKDANIDSNDLSELVATIAYNIASGNWQYVAKRSKGPLYEPKHRKDLLKRTPKYSLDYYYQRILPVFVPHLVRLLDQMTDAIEANDRLTALNLLNSAKKLIVDEVTLPNPRVLDYVARQKDITQMVVAEDRPTTARRGRKEYFFKPIYDDKEILDEFGDYLK